MPEKLFNFLGSLPFLLIVKKLDHDHIAMNWTRIAEAILIAVISGLFAGYISLTRLEAKFDILAEQVKTGQQQLFDHINQNKSHRR